METRHSYKEPITCADTAVHVSSDMLFSDYMLNWLSIIKNSVVEDTYAGYESIVKESSALLRESRNHPGEPDGSGH